MISRAAIEHSNGHHGSRVGLHVRGQVTDHGVQVARYVGLGQGGDGLLFGMVDGEE